MTTNNETKKRPSTHNEGLPPEKKGGLIGFLYILEEFGGQGILAVLIFIVVAFLLLGYAAYYYN